MRGDGLGRFDAKERAMMKIGHFCLALFLTTNLMQVSQAATKPVAGHYLGIAYARNSGTVLYSEEHWITRGPREESRLVLYRCPGGQPFARKRVHGPIGGAVPDFDFYDHRDGYREGVSGRGGERRVYVQHGQAGSRQSSPLPARPNAVIDAGFDAYLRSHWDALGEGRDTNIAFLVPSRLAYIDLKIHVRDKTTASPPVRQFHLSLNAWYGFVAPSINVTYSMRDRRLLRFEGVSNIRDNQGDTQQVRIEFPPNKRYPPPSRQQIERAEAEPLVSHCGIPK